MKKKKKIERIQVIVRVKWEHKLEEQKSTKKVEIFYKGQEEFIKIFDDYWTIVPGAKLNAI